MKLNRKNKLLVIGFFLSLYVCYVFAFSNTFDYYKEYQSQKEIANNNVNNPVVLQKLIQKEKQLNDLLNQYNTVTGNSFQNELLKQLTFLSKQNALRIIDFKEPHVITEKGIKTSSYIFSLEGSFNGMLLLINNIENNPSFGYVKHIMFTKKRNYKTNTDYLISEIVLQKSESIKNKLGS